ncbi:hypothetical protein A2U01_0116655 [Trifolium medium]|uniref:Uncharacterized protein n=1 Tax=Trifolium medium TaxID=97028 RepID=A0A392W4V6_9FABA|nr:hypothetical protein [Trifolium medium]
MPFSPATTTLSSPLSKRDDADEERDISVSESERERTAEKRVNGERFDE